MDAARAQLNAGRTTTRAVIAAVKSAATASAIEGASLAALKAWKGLVAVTKHPAGHARWRCCVDQ